MARWALLLETSEPRHVNDPHHQRVWEWTLTRVGYAEGTREDALGQLRAHAEQLIPHRPSLLRRRSVYAVSDGYVVEAEGKRRSHCYRFTLGEVLEERDMRGVELRSEPEDRQRPDYGRL
ncbi:hypothetical protein [Streptomyces sp. ODS28]|uniref:hypothetical protein n=1 Tax=Streptomyces sp. ODS28 TaxID=3136688 RepID=UPI0031E59D6E